MKRFGLIGYPLDHSFSKKYFTEKFKAEGLEDHSFELYPLNQIIEFPYLLEQDPALIGLAVTIPYKESVIDYLDQLSPEAQAIGAVNCISFHDHRTIGYNTDSIGFERSLLPLIDLEKINKALVLGSGGASKAVHFILNKLKIECKIVSRKNDKRFMLYEQINAEILKTFNIIINTTPLGMYPHTELYPFFPYEHLNESHLVYDLIYNPDQTLFLQKARSGGARIKNGYEMLIIQAEENWKIWNTKQ